MKEAAVVGILLRLLSHQLEVIWLGSLVVGVKRLVADSKLLTTSSLPPTMTLSPCARLPSSNALTSRP